MLAHLLTVLGSTRNSSATSAGVSSRSPSEVSMSQGSLTVRALSAEETKPLSENCEYGQGQVAGASMILASVTCARQRAHEALSKTPRAGHQSCP